MTDLEYTVKRPGLPSSGGGDNLMSCTSATNRPGWLGEECLACLANFERNHNTMKVNYCTRVQAPATTNPPPLQMNLPKVVTDDTSTPNLDGSLDGSYELSQTTSSNRRAVADRSDGRVALLTKREAVGFGTWNTRTLLQEGKLDILFNQMKKFKWEVLGTSETHWTDAENFHHKASKSCAQVMRKFIEQE